MRRRATGPIRALTRLAALIRLRAADPFGGPPGASSCDPPGIDFSCDLPKIDFSCDPPGIDPPLCVVGDVHGCDAQLAGLLRRIDAMPDRTRARLVFAGDLIDRGPDSAAVLARVRSLAEPTPAPGTGPGTDPGAAVAAAPPPAVCLMGNHERMMLDFLDDPAGRGARWLSHGGIETLASLGLHGRAAGPTGPERLAALARDARRALPPGTEDWLRALPLAWRDRHLAVSHAGGDPGRPLDDQPARALVWGHPKLARRPRADGVWMIHGHVPGPAVRVGGGRVAVDTGAVRGGPLSAAWIDAGGLTVIAEPPEV